MAEKKTVKKKTAKRVVNKKPVGVSKKDKKAVPLFLGVLIIIIIAAIAALIIFVGLETVGGTPVKIGDNVTVYYFVETPEKDFNNSGEFTFLVGSGQVIDGFDSNVIGMVKGGEKSFTLTPDEAYGDFDPEQTVLWPLEQETDRTINMTIENFNLSFGENPVLDKAYDAIVYPWMVRVVKIENDIVWLQHEPEDEQIVELPYGASMVKVMGDKLVVKLFPLTGSQFTSVYGPYGFPVIMDANETHMILDLNHPLAGKTLVFSIKLLDVIPA
ncbi:MAG: FKBP-type peptidyl-prolyl cis-trans isomerase [Candidatus Aenigmarchaeota archaeon]|nr:FKBP-type peptidyl-prolyl cis-trans isomerase [Candidatus Aenigmarchaeota archaeon]